MKTKHLFLTLMMLLASATLSWGRTVTDVIVPGATSFNVSQNQSGAVYAGTVSSNGTTICFNSDKILYTYSSNGVCTKVRVTFSGSPKELQLYSRSNTPYSGIESVDYDHEPATAIKPEGRSSVAEVEMSSPQYLHFEYYTEGNIDVNVTEIVITWEIPDPATEVTFIAEHEGAYYAVGHNLDANGLEAVKVQVVDGKVVLTSAATLAAITWYRRTSGFDTGAHTFQNASAGKFLTINGSQQISLLDAEGLYSPAYEKSGVYSWANCALVYDAEVDRFVSGAGATAATGAAVQYVNSATTFESYNASKHAFTRTFNSTNISAICLPYAIAAADLQDVNVYTLEGKTVDAEGNLTGISLLEKEDGMQAGVPYIIRAKSASKTTIVFPYGGNKSTEKGIVEVGGIVGNLGATVVISTSEDDDIYFLSSNRLKYLVDGTFTLGTNKCYLHMAGLDPIAPVQAPGRIFLNTDEYQQPNTATNVEDVEAKNLNWNEPVYNLMGQRVAEGATGVLIQNGKKFMIY